MNKLTIPEAELLYQRALQIREHALGSEHVDTANTLHDFAMLWQAQGIHEKARIFYERALAILLRLLGPTHPYTIDTYLRLRAVLVAIGETEEFVLPDEDPGSEKNGNGAGQEEGTRNKM